MVGEQGGEGWGGGGGGQGEEMEWRLLRQTLWSDKDH